MREDWIEVEFGELCKFSQGIQVPKDKQYPDNNDKRVRFLRIVDFTQGNEVPRYIEKPEDSNIVSKEDISMVRYGTVGFVCTDKEGAIANNLFKVIPKIKIDNKYLINYLKSDLFKRHINSKGATMQALSFGLIKPIKIPLAPLPEQRAIVAKIEELFSDLDNGIANLKKAQEQLKIYRQAVLKKAFEGELTKEWREKVGMSETWQKDTLKNVTSMNPRPLKDRIAADLEIQFLPMRLVEEVKNKIHLNETRKFHEVQKKSYTFFEEGDVLFAKVTPCMENGKIAIAKDLKNKMGYGSSEFHVFRVNGKLSNEYLFHFLVQEKFRADSQHAMTGAVGLKRVPKKFLEDYEIPLPQIDEQHQIVQEIESRLSVCDKVEQSITESLEKAQALRQSILKKAFEGTLLSPPEIAACKAAKDYQPASALLEKIKKEKQNENK